MHKLSICTIAKDELDLEEWISYHCVVGVEHFYIYDNGSRIPIKNTLQKYIDKNIVSCIDFPGASRQMPAFNDCLTRFGKDNQWIAFVDADEYLVPKQADNVSDVLDQFIQYGGLQVNWVLFGSNGWQQRPSGLIIENYTKASGADWKDNLHTKSIVQPQFATRAGGNPHYFNYTSNYFAVDEKERPIFNAWSLEHSVQLLQLNHYANKSLQDFASREARGRADGAHLPTRTLQSFQELDTTSTIEDTNILRFIQLTKSLYL